jgi:hypothetical protein
MGAWWDSAEWRAGVVAYCVAVAGVAVFLAVVAAVTGAAWLSWAVIVFCPLGLLLFMLAIQLLAAQPWRCAADVKAMLAGQAWVHWTYDEASWRAANRFDEWVYKAWVRGLLAALAVGGFLLMIGLLGGQSTVFASIFGGLIIFLASVMLPVLMLGDPVRAARRAKVGDIYVSRNGIYRRPGGYTRLDLRAGVKYESVELVERPTPHIHIVAQVKETAGRKIPRWRRKTLADVGVPPGYEDEARELVVRLRNEVINAHPRQPRMLD